MLRYSCMLQRLWMRKQTFQWSYWLQRTSSCDSHTHSSCYERKIEINPRRHQRKMRLAPESSLNSRLLKVAILGAPNAGKSVLTNCLVGSNVCVVSSKVNTTRHLTYAVAVDGDTQMVFLDTPGVLSPEKKKKLKLDDSLLLDPEVSLKQAQLIAVVVDVANPQSMRCLHPRILHLLHRYRAKPCILVLNKIDIMQNKRDLLEITFRLTNGVVAGQPVERKVPKLLQDTALSIAATKLRDMTDLSSGVTVLTGKFRRTSKHAQKSTDMDSTTVGLVETEYDVCKGLLEQIVKLPMHEVLESQIRRCFEYTVGWAHFDAVFMISALEQTGVDELREYLLANANAEEWKFHSSIITDQNPVELVKNIVRGKLLDALPREIPYNLDLKVAVWEINEHEVLCIRMDVICSSERIAKMLIGPKGAQINQVAIEANQELRNVFQRDVYLKLGATVREMTDAELERKKTSHVQTAHRSIRVKNNG